jgi:hypothetical protein
MAAGDNVVLKTYFAVDGTTPDKADEATFTGPQDIPVIRVPATTLPYNGKFRLTLTQTAGSLKSFPFYLIVQVTEVI